MPDALVKARLGVKSQFVMPKPVRKVLGIAPGDDFAFLIQDGEVKVVRATPEEDNPFACFTEWASEADRKGYADL